MNRTDKTVLTIGHSNHPLEAFLALLARHRVTAVADVRSAPYSRFNPHFNRDSLVVVLKAREIEYVYLGRELGGRSSDPACYEDGHIRYDRVARTDRFRDGLKRVIRGAAKHRIALMCAEKEPLDCHRTILVARALVEDCGAAVTHILADGRLEPHDETIKRMRKELSMVEPDLFSSPAELTERAYAAQASRIAYVDEELARATPEAQP